MVTARPWKGTVRRHSTARPLVVGIATDTSGSMRWAEDGVAEFAYVWTNAGHRIGARTAAVTFGDHVHRIARPGEVMTHVERKSATDGQEAFDFAAAALDGVLHFTTPAYAARILLVISDGQLVKDGEPDRAAEWLRRMDRAGTHVLWIGDRDWDNHYSGWLPKLARKLPKLTLVTAEREMGRRRRSWETPTHPTRKRVRHPQRGGARSDQGQRHLDSADQKVLIRPARAAPSGPAETVPPAGGRRFGPRPRLRGWCPRWGST